MEMIRKSNAIYSILRNVITCCNVQRIYTNANLFIYVIVIVIGREQTARTACAIKMISLSFFISLLLSRRQVQTKSIAQVNVF